MSILDCFRIVSSAAKVTSAASMATTATETATTATETAKALAKVTSAAKALETATTATSAAMLAKVTSAETIGRNIFNSFTPGAANNHGWHKTMADNNSTSFSAMDDGNKIVVEGIADVDQAAKIVGKELSLAMTGRMKNYSFSRTLGIKEFDIEWEVGIAAKSVYFRANSSRTNDSVDGTRVIFYVVKEDWKEFVKAWRGK